MGNCFGKESKKFQGEGRPLNSAPAPAGTSINARTSVPAPKKQLYTPTPTGGRTLGSSVDAGGNDPKSAAARAAEERAKAAQGQGGKGKLARQLDAQKTQTHNTTLAATSAENRAARDADAGAQARAWN